jgi:beta-galactosidase
MKEDGMNKDKFAGMFPLGSHLCREPMPAMPELKRDMENLKRHGFNLVKLQENWMVDEPLEGRYDFSRYEELIEHARGLDLGVYLGLTCEQAPNWLWEKHPGCRMVGKNGLPVAYQAQTTLPADGKPGPCYDHDGAREDQLRFIRKLVQVLGRFENIVVWNTWQEIAYWAERFAGQPVCYCPHTIAHFRAWLERKYGDLDSLNRAWNARYLAWDSIVPERRPEHTCVSVEIDWRYFMDNVQIGRVLMKRAEAIRAADPLKRPIFAHKGGPIIGSGVDWTYARCQDWLGSSAYPAWAGRAAWDDINPSRGNLFDRREALLLEAWDGVAMRYDYIRSANRRGSPVWAAEFQGGPVSTFFHKGRVPSPADIRRWMLTAAGSGVSAISFWVTRAEIMAHEMNGFSLLDSTGETTPRYEEASRVGRALQAHADLFAAPTFPSSPVAIVINEANYQLCACLSQGGENLAYSVRGWHRLLWEAGVPVDFLEASELDEQYARDYKLLILPFPLSISEAFMGQLSRLVEAGATLVSEACIGRLSEQGMANRGEISPAAATLFGVRQEGLTMVREPDGGNRWSPVERTWGEYLDPAKLEGIGPFSGTHPRANVYIQTFETAGSSAIATFDGHPAAVAAVRGKGKAILLGTFVGHSGTAYRCAENAAFIRRLLKECGISPTHSGSLLLRRRVIQTKEAWILTNPTEKTVTESIDMKGWKSAKDLLGDDILRVEKGKASVTVESLDVKVIVLEKA